MAQEVEVKPEGPAWLKEETSTHKLCCGEYCTSLLWHGPRMENTQVRGRIKRQRGEVSILQPRLCQGQLRHSNVLCHKAPLSDLTGQLINTQVDESSLHLHPYPAHPCLSS